MLEFDYDLIEEKESLHSLPVTLGVDPASVPQSEGVSWPNGELIKEINKLKTKKQLRTEIEKIREEKDTWERKAHCVLCSPQSSFGNVPWKREAEERQVTINHLDKVLSQNSTIYATTVKKLKKEICELETIIKTSKGIKLYRIDFKDSYDSKTLEAMSYERDIDVTRFLLNGYCIYEVQNAYIISIEIMS